MWHRIGKHCNKYWGERGAGMVLTDGKSVLLLKRSEKGDNFGKWCIPGGKAEDEETFLGCAQREVREEIGKLPPARRIASFEAKDGRHVFHTYIAAVPERFDCKLSDEHSDYHWFPLDDLPEVDLHDKLAEVIEDVVSIIKKQMKNKPDKHEMKGFAEFVETMGATADLKAGYTKGGPDYQVEGDPSSMIRPRRKSRLRKS